MSKTITSGMISVIDTTDARKLDIFIASNLPTVQIKDSNLGTFSPDWSNTPLTLQPTIYLNSQDVSSSSTYIWYCKYGTGTDVQISTNRNLTVNTNLTDISGIVTYKCVATYQGLNATDSIVFNRSDSGTNGISANNVIAQYSANGTSGWTPTLNASTHKYIRLSYNNGDTWTSAIKIVGQDGTSVTIEGSYDTYAELVAAHATGQAGDSYIVDGDLYIWDIDTSAWKNVGTIQGPQGNPGTSSYTFIRYATSSAGANMSASPSGKTYIGIAVTSTNSAPASASSYTWSKYVGEDAKSITLSANSQIFKINTSSVASPSTITVVGTPVNTSITTWQYSTDGGANFVTTLPNGVTRNGNQVTITGASITSNSITVRATDGTYSDTLTVFKVLDGANGNQGNAGTPASLAFLTNEHINFVANSNGQVAGQTITTNVVAYTGSTKVTPVLGTITGLPTGMTITAANITTASNEKIIPIAITADATFGSTSSNSGIINIPITSPVNTNLKLNWSKVNAGAQGNAGVGISAIAEYYAVSTSNSTVPTNWQSTPPTMTSTNKYLWNYETITYTNNTTYDTEKRVIGAYGNTGSSGTSITISSTSVTYQAGTSGTTQPTGIWSTAIPTVNNGQYLWTKTVVLYSNGTSTEAYSVSYKGTNGSNGTGVTISSTSVTYQASTSGTTAPTGTWATTIPNVSNGQFLWTRTIVTYSNSTSTTSYSVSYKGTNGAKGDTGNGISSITNYYLATNSSSGVTTSTTGWTTAVQTTTTSKQYLWNYEVINYTNGTNTTSSTRIIGTHGTSGTNAVSFQIYAPKGYVLSKDLQSITLQTFAQEGTTTITSGATYRWYEYVDNDWSLISSATSNSLSINKDSVLQIKSYKCEMTYKSKQYVHTVTVQDKSDTHNAVMQVASGVNSTTNTQYWVMYPTVYSELTEEDALLGTVSRNSPSSPVNGIYWYFVDSTNKIATLKKYNGTTWADSVDEQDYVYDWFMTNADGQKVILPGTSKVKIIDAHDFTNTVTIECRVSSRVDGLIAICSMILTDVSDPILSDTAPIDPKDGQLWLKRNSERNTFSLFMYNTTEGWIAVNDDDKQNIYTSKPTSYKVGDLWITESDGAHESYIKGTLLQAKDSRTTYSSSDWEPTLKYDTDFQDIQNTLKKYAEIMNVTSEGLQMAAVSSTGEISKFKALFTSTELCFYESDKKILRLINDRLMAPKIEVDDLIIDDSFSIGPFKFIRENNGSLSITIN